MVSYKILPELLPIKFSSDSPAKSPANPGSHSRSAPINHIRALGNDRDTFALPQSLLNVSRLWQ